MPRILQPKVTFYVDKSNRNKSGLVPIKANIGINYKNVTKTIDLVFPSDWNKKQQRVRPPRPNKTNNHEPINEKLDLIQKEFGEYVRNCERNRTPITPERAKQFLNGERTLSEKPFWNAYDEYLAVKGQQIQPKTLQSFTLYRKKLREFEIETGYFIDYHTINTAFFEMYKTYVLSTKELGWNTFATAIKKLKFFMNWSLKMKYHSEKEYKDLSAPEKEPTIIFLTMDELSTLYKKDFKNKRLNQARDKFCFGCFTGLAFADLDSLKPEHINEGTLTKLRQKTKIPLEIVLSKQAGEIIERYAGRYDSLPKISHQRFNEYIKECCKIAGIKTPTIYKTFPKGIETENIAPKHELVGTHTARKTFITNFYHQTKDAWITKKVAGINSDKTLRRYKGVDKEMQKEAMQKAFGKL